MGSRGILCYIVIIHGIANRQKSWDEQLQPFFFFQFIYTYSHNRNINASSLFEAFIAIHKERTHLYQDFLTPVPSPISLFVTSSIWYCIRVHVGLRPLPPSLLCVQYLPLLSLHRFPFCWRTQQQIFTLWNTIEPEPSKFWLKAHPKWQKCSFYLYFLTVVASIWHNNTSIPPVYMLDIDVQNKLNFCFVAVELFATFRWVYS